MTKPAEKIEEKKLAKYINIKPSQLSPPGHMTRQMTVIAAADQTLEDLMEPKAWASVSHQLRIWDSIEVISEDTTWVAKLFVTSITKQWVNVECLFHKELQKTETPDAADSYEVKWKGPHLLFCVIRKADGTHVAERLSKEDAYKQKSEYEKLR